MHCWEDSEVANRRKIILKYAKPHKYSFLLLFFCVVITTFSGAIYPYIFGLLVDEVFYGKNMGAFLNIVLIYAIVYSFNQCMHFVLNITWARLMTTFLFDIRESIFSKVISYKGKKLTNIHSGDIISRMNNDTNKFMNFIHWNVFYTIGGALELLLALGFIFFINTWIGIYAIVLTPVVVYISRFFSTLAKKHYKNFEKEKGILSSWLFEIIGGIQDIKMFSSSKNILLNYVGKTIRIMRLQIKSDRVEILSERVNSGISLLAQMIFYITSVIFVSNGDLTIGEFVACTAFFGTCTSIFNSLNDKIVNISSDMVSIDRVVELFDEESEQSNCELPDITIKKGNILFSDVKFSYISEVEILKGINLNVSANEQVALVGASGAGKTTMANLIYKLYDIDHGKISIDGINIQNFNLHNLRNQIGIVHQENEMFKDTIRFNLAFTSSDKNDDKIWDALRKVHLYNLIKELPNKLDTQIGLEGMNFSGGEKQRLAIARILIKKPKILIFDEATSSLDSEAESVIKSCWSEICEDRTILVIAHRLSTILTSDKIAIVSNGVIAGYDSHHKLIESCHEYQELFREQFSNGGLSNE